MVDGAQSGSTGQSSEGGEQSGTLPGARGFGLDVQGQVRATCSGGRTRTVSAGCVEMGVSHGGVAHGRGSLDCPALGELGPAGMGSWELW